MKVGILTNLLVLDIPGPDIGRPLGPVLGNVCEPGIGKLLLVLEGRVERAADIGEALEEQLGPLAQGRVREEGAVITCHGVDDVLHFYPAAGVEVSVWGGN